MLAKVHRVCYRGWVSFVGHCVVISNNVFENCLKVYTDVLSKSVTLPFIGWTEVTGPLTGGITSTGNLQGQKVIIPASFMEELIFFMEMLLFLSVAPLGIILPMELSTVCSIHRQGSAGGRGRSRGWARPQCVGLMTLEGQCVYKRICTLSN